MEETCLKRSACFKRKVAVSRDVSSPIRSLGDFQRWLVRQDRDSAGNAYRASRRYQKQLAGMPSIRYIKLLENYFGLETTTYMKT